MLRTQKGFTIVELLIVIVVIGILAAITIVTFNGVQVKAQNVATIDAAAKYKRIFLAYAAQNGSYPSGTAITGYCLGTGYTDMNSDGRGDCVFDGNGNYVSETDSYNTMLKTLAALPAVTTRMYTRTSDSAKVGGIRYDSGSDRTVDGVSNPYWLVYDLQNSTSKCGSDTVQITTWPAFSKTGGYPDVFGTSAVQCWMPLPTPS